jgi:ABC-type glycerol-3-phosphate transport system permease component
MNLNKDYYKKLIFYAILILGVGISLFPFYWMFIASFKNLSEIFEYPPKLFPENFNLENYINLFKQTPFAKNMFNSIFVSVSYMILSVFISSTAGFALSKYRNAKGRVTIFIFIIATMMIPTQIIVIPLYILMGKINWINSYQALILPFAANGFGIFLIKQYIDDIPDSLLEAARIDGCSELRVYWQIVLPVIKPALAALATIYFMNNWNLFFWPLIATNMKEMFTVPIALAQLIDRQYNVPYHLVMAGSTIATIPLMIIFLLFQKQFIAGITAGAIKE